MLERKETLKRHFCLQVILTGSDSPLGQAIGREFSAHGAKCCGIGRDSKGAHVTIKGRLAYVAIFSSHTVNCLNLYKLLSPSKLVEVDDGSDSRTKSCNLMLYDHDGCSL